MTLLGALTGALFVSGLAALAVDMGFGAAFVSSGVALGTAAYTAALSVVLVGRDPQAEHFVDRISVRIVCALGVSALMLLLLRSVLLFPTPLLGEFATTGHSPYIVFPACGVTSVAVLHALRRLRATK